MEEQQQFSPRAEKTKLTEKQKKRRRIMLLRRIKVGAGLSVALVLVLYLLSAFVFFKISAIEVIGIEDEDGNMLPCDTYYSAEEIIKVSGVETGDSLVRVSKSDVADAVEKLLPYVGSITVKRRFPSTLRFVIEETSAVYGADAGGGYTLMNEDFKVLGVSEKAPAGCARLSGISFETAETGETAVFTDEAFKSRLENITSACKNAGIDNVTKIDLSNIANVKIVINHRVTMIIGTITDLADKLSMGLKTMEAEMKNASDIKIIIDVTDSERSYVRTDYSPIEDYEETSDIMPTDEELPEENEQAQNSVNEENDAQEEAPEEEPEEEPEAVG